MQLTLLKNPFYSNNKKLLIGYWLIGKQNGNGTISFQNGDKYSGEFKDGVICGQGQMIYSNGETHQGEFKDGQIYFLKKGKRRFLGQILDQFQIFKISFILFIAFIIYN